MPTLHMSLYHFQLIGFRLGIWVPYRVMAYSTSGRTRVKYAFSMMAVAPMFRFRRRKPIVLFALSHLLAVG